MHIAFTHNLQRDHDDESQAEFDRQETVDAISGALRALGHVVTAIDVGAAAVADTTARLAALKPDLVFNTAEGTHGRFREALWPAIFDALGLPFTGADAWACAVTLDKQLTKLLVKQAGIRTPEWRHVTTTAHVNACAGMRFPLIAKPNAEGSSKGITTKSIVEDEPALRALLADLVPRYPAGVLVEEFIVGKDVVVPWLEAASPSTGGVLSPCSYQFDAAIIGERKYTIYDYELKCVKSEAVTVEAPASVSDDVLRELVRQSRVVYDALSLRDLGRIDWRVDERGQIWFIEVNALPSLEPGAGIYVASALAGLPDVTDVIGAVVRSAAQRNGLATTTTSAAPRLRVGFTYNLKRVVAKSASDDDSDAEYDAESTIGAICQAIVDNGHDVVRLEATSLLPAQLAAAGVDLVFNMAEGRGGRGREAQVPALLELVGLHHTGSDAVTMALTLDKDLCKRVVGAAGVPVPQGRLLTGDEPAEAYGGLVYPVIAKPNAEGSSKGVLPECVVEDERALRALLVKLYARYRQPILVEEFLPGREFTIAMLGRVGHAAPEVLPPMEIVFLDGDARHPVYAFEDKLDWSASVRYDRPAVVDDDLRAKLTAVAVGAWQALGCRDVARVDVRCDGNGTPRFIECNPIPGLAPGWSDLCLIADAAGIDYTTLIGRILAPAVARARAHGRS